MWEATSKVDLLYRSSSNPMFLNLRNIERMISRDLPIGQRVILFDNMTGMQTTTTLVEKPNTNTGRPEFIFENGSSFQLNRTGKIMTMTLNNTVKAPKETLDRYEIKVEFRADDQTSFKIPASSTVRYVDGTNSTWAELLDGVISQNRAKPFMVNGMIYVVVKLNNELLQTSLKTEMNRERVIEYPSFGA